jgi:hypothetical protein
MLCHIDEQKIGSKGVFGKESAALVSFFIISTYLSFQRDDKSSDDEMIV